MGCQGEVACQESLSELFRLQEDQQAALKAAHGQDQEGELDCTALPQVFATVCNFTTAR